MRYSRRFLLHVAVSLALAGVAAASSVEYEVVRVVEDVYAFLPGDMGMGNVVAIVTDADAIVVDASATPSGATRIIEQIRRLTDRPVRYVISTHWHDDHIWGNQAFRDEYPGVAFVAHERTRAGIVEQAIPALAENIERMKRKVGEREALLQAGVDTDGNAMSDDRRALLRERVDLFRGVVADFETISPVLPTMTLRDGLTFARDDGPVEIRYLGKGHSDGDLVVYLPAKGVVIAGDLLTHPILSGSYPIEWIDTLKALSRLDADVIVPGHGPPLRGRVHLRQSIELLESVVGQVRKAVSRGFSIERTREVVDVRSFRSSMVGDDPRLGKMFDEFFLRLAVDRAYASLIEGSPTEESRCESALAEGRREVTDQQQLE